MNDDVNAYFSYCDTLYWEHQLHKQIDVVDMNNEYGRLIRRITALTENIKLSVLQIQIYLNI